MQLVNLLLLSSPKDGFTAHLAHTNFWIFDFLGDAKRILFIPFGKSEAEYDVYTTEISHVFLPYNKEIVSIVGNSNPLQLLDEVDAIFVGDGNSYQLLHQLEQRGLLTAIADKVKQGLPYIGMGAGAMIASPTIQMSKEMPIQMVKNYQSLALVDFHIVVNYPEDRIHYPPVTEVLNEEIGMCMQTNHIPAAIALRQAGGLCMSQGRIDVLGAHPMQVFRLNADPFEIYPQKSIPTKAEQISVLINEDDYEAKLNAESASDLSPLSSREPSFIVEQACIHVYADADSGNVEVVSAKDLQDIRVRIKKDTHSEHFQWFNFYVQAQPYMDVKVYIENAGEASYPYWNDGLEYQVMASYDGDFWERLSTKYQNGMLEIQFNMQIESIVQLAFYAPYPYHRHLALIEQANEIPNAHIVSLGQTIEHRDMTLIRVGTPAPHKKNCWIIARQHPGETHAEWFMEGLVEKLLSEEVILDDLVLYLVPNMNPDGTYHGHLRTNFMGMDLNRTWENPNSMLSREVYLVREAMLNIGVDLLLDIHSDEEHPDVFPVPRGVGCTPNKKIEAIESKFIQLWQSLSPLLRAESCYEPDAPGAAPLGVASAFMANYVQCLSFTIEMPFKDVKTETGSVPWMPEDCKKLGANVLEVIQKIIPDLPKTALQAPRKNSFIAERKEKGWIAPENERSCCHIL